MQHWPQDFNKSWKFEVRQCEGVPQVFFSQNIYSFISLRNLQNFDSYVMGGGNIHFGG